ncbi:outer membrane beta-barrel protein [Tenacibaculum xiamenense]|uniref:outer membrane beta-barrel protein n=1 Tax=Tenacibaculum xiamenense TaxID=1261553 RepID=UPI0038955540
MKNFLVAAMMLIGLAANAQEGELNVGGTIGLPVGDASDAFDVTGAIEANYLFNVSEKFKVGPSVSYLHFNGEGPDVAFLPLAAAARYSVSDKFIIGADLGYGIGVRPDGNDGGFYYRPMVGYKVTDKITLHANYAAVSRSEDLGILGSVSVSTGTFGIGGTYSFSL